jgi:hypothetical protein
MSVSELVRDAEAILPGTPAPSGADDPRWQAIIAIGEYVESHPEEVWSFVARWGTNTEADLRDAVATCLLEHLLAHHFELIFPRVEELTKTDRMFADTFSRCWKFGQAESSENAKKIDRLRVWCSTRRGA